MKPVKEHEYTTYPRRFITYKWYKPLLVGVLMIVFLLLFALVVDILTKVIFGGLTQGEGYDGMDFFTAAGAFDNGAKAAIYVPAFFLAALIVKDRPISSYFSSMGGWRWKVFLRTLLAAFVILGIPTIIWYFMHGKISDVKFTPAGFILLTLFVPFQSLGEEMTYRGFITQTISSWFCIPAAGIIAQIIFFTVVHPYNIIGIIEIAVSALLYCLICLVSKGVEAPTSLHIANNLFEIYMAGFGYTLITADQNVPNIMVNLFFKILFFLFILYADRKLHWFSKVQFDDVAAFNEKMSK